MHRLVRADLTLHFKWQNMTWLFILSILCFAYLAYVLVRPEKF